MNKKLIILVISAGLLLFCTKSSQEVPQPTGKSPTKYLNLDFEDYRADNPRFWFTSGNGYRIKIDTAEKVSGKSSLSMESIAKEVKFAVATSRFPVKAALGKSVKLSGYIKTREVTTGFAGLWMRADGKKKTAISFDNMQNQKVNGTRAWKEYSISLKIPPETVNINFGVLISGQGKAWFDNLKVFIDDKPYKQVKPVPLVPTKEDLAWLKKNVIPIKTADPIEDHNDLEKLKEIIKNKKIVALGEGTHGTSEFFRMKHRILKFLVEELDFSVFAIEANMPECRAVNQYVLYGKGDPKKALNGLYFWTWYTEEVLNMIKWMREYNKSHRKKIAFYGFDMQETRVALEELSRFIRKVDSRKWQNFNNLKKDIVTSQMYQKFYNKKIQKLEVKKGVEAAGKILKLTESLMEKALGQFTKPDIDWNIQNARIVLQCSRMYAGRAGRARIRDASMAENLRWILDQHPKETKVVTWAHNGHVSKSPRYKMAMGYFLDKVYKDNMIVFGFAFHEGTYVARGKKGLSIYGTSPSEPGSFEWFFKKSGIENFILDLRLWKKGEPGSEWLEKKLNFRSIGALAIDYAFYETRITEHFDGIIFFEKTTPSACFRIIDQ